MNIFLLCRNLKKCAQFHCDQHVIKMILEAAQMLCTAVHLSGGESPYKPNHQRHPCTLWVCASLSNWRFLKELATELNKEYKYRYERETNHKSFDVIQSLHEPLIPDIGLTSFAVVMPDVYKEEDAIQSYRNYYAAEKFRFATWRKRSMPSWFLPLRDKLIKDGVIDLSKADEKPEEKKQTKKKVEVKPVLPIKRQAISDEPAHPSRRASERLLKKKIKVNES